MSLTPALHRGNGHMGARAALVAVALLLAAACATGGAFRAGQRAERVEDFDLAVVEYNKAVRANPSDRNARTASVQPDPQPIVSERDR